MIIQYREHSVATEIHTDKHEECQPDHLENLEEGWECICSYCKCDDVLTIQARYSYTSRKSHEVTIKIHNGGIIALPPNVARALASALCFAANDADQLNKDYPND